MTTRQVKYEEIIKGVRTRVYATRSELEVLLGDGSIDDPDATVWVYPKMIGPYAAAHQAILDNR